MWDPVKLHWSYTNEAGPAYIIRNVKQIYSSSSKMTPDGNQDINKGMMRIYTWVNKKDIFLIISLKDDWLFKVYIIMYCTIYNKMEVKCKTRAQERKKNLSVVLSVSYFTYEVVCHLKLIG